MSVLVIAPSSPDLDKQQNEVDALLRALPDAVAVTGSVTEGRLIEFFGREYDGIWFSGHGNSEGILLGDILLGVDDLISYVNRSGAEWVVLNACESDELASRLLLATDADLLVVSKEILDTDAWRVARLIAYELKEHNDIRRAVDTVLSGRTGRHRFYPNEKRARMNRDTDNISERIDRLIGDVGTLAQRIATVEAKIDGVDKRLQGQKEQFILWFLAACGASTVIAGLVFRFMHT